MFFFIVYLVRCIRFIHFRCLSVISFLLIGPGEEYFFRGAIQNKLNEDYSIYSAIFLSGLIFGAFHYANYNGDQEAVFIMTGLIAFIGMLFGYAYHKTDNILVPILCHGLYNSIAAYLLLTL